MYETQPAKSLLADLLLPPHWNTKMLLVVLLFLCSLEPITQLPNTMPDVRLAYFYPAFLKLFYPAHLLPVGFYLSLTSIYLTFAFTPRLAGWLVVDP